MIEVEHAGMGAAFLRSHSGTPIAHELGAPCETCDTAPAEGLEHNRECHWCGELIYCPSCANDVTGTALQTFDAGHAEGLDVERLEQAIDKASEYVSTGHGHPPRIQHQMWASGAKASLAAIAREYDADT